MERMESGYLCEVLHFLLKERHGTPLVKLTVDLVEVDNEASLNLLCALFKHFESADNAELNEAVTKLNLKNEINAYITQLCKNVIHLLELGDILVTDRTTLVEKCLIFYNRLLDFKYAGITEKVLCMPQNLELLKHILKRYKQSAAVQKNVIDIIFKRYPLSDEELLALAIVAQILPQDVIDSLQQSWLDLKTSGNAQATLEEVQQHETVSKLRQLLNLALENHLHYEAYQRALKEGVAIPLKYLKVLFFGPPRTGKTSTRRRLVREIKNLTNEPVQASTGTAEHYDAIVKMVDDKTTYSKAVITKSEWSNVKALFNKEKGSHETDLDEELQLLYQFIYDVSQTKNKSPINRPDSRSPLSTSVIEKEAQDKVTQRQSQAREKTDTASDESHEVDPNASISTPQVSSVRELSAKQMEEVVREHRLSAEEKKEIEKAFEAFNKILHRGGQEQLKVLLKGTILMNMIDTGGQPAFLEMLPALTMGPALYLIFFRLNQELKTRYEVRYVSEDQENVRLGDSSYTVEEVIFQALSSITCFSCTTPKKDDIPKPSHAAVLIGTHKDLLGSDPEAKIKDKDGKLRKEIKETDLFKSEENFLHDAFDDQLMFAIDNMNGDKEELREVQKRLEEIINQQFSDDFPIPASWLMFNIFLRKMGKRTLTLLECHEIGRELSMSNTDDVLWFLHHCVGTLMHFPEIEEIKDVVICDPQVVFDSVTDLILNSFTLKYVPKSVCEKFVQTGKFSFENIQKIATKSKRDSLTLPKLIKLLEHLNIIAPIKLSPQSDARQKKELEYFMPAVLEHAKEEELDIKQGTTDPVPLMIHFKCGFVPVGVFCATIASLVAQKKWKLLEPSEKYMLYKNKVTFRIYCAYDITLVSRLKWYEIHVVKISSSGKTLEYICKHVLETVCDTLDQVILLMKHKPYQISSSPDQSLYELGFKCPEHPNDDHLVINTLEEEVEGQSPSVNSLWSNYLEGKSIMICRVEGEKIVDLRDNPSSAQHLVWFRKAAETSPVPSVSIPDTGTSHEYLCGFETFAETSFIVPDSHSHSYEWQQYGLKLHIPEGAVPAECRVDIKAGFAGQFNIPDDLQLVSCVYWLSCSQKFMKPVTLEVEHCASIQESSQSLTLQFITAKGSQAELPYQFEVMESGIFGPKSSYGSIRVSQFSFFAIGIFKRFQSLQHYCSTVYYIQKGVNKWNVDFVVAPNLQASLTAIQERYSSLDATSGAGFEVQFEDKAISLAILDDGICLPNGWVIKPLASPMISKQQVAMFKPGQLIPCCQLRVRLDHNENPVELEHKVDLLGTKGPNQFFTITCSPQVTSAAATHTPSLATTDDGMLFPSNESTTSSNQDLGTCDGAEMLGISNVADITSYLHLLDKTAVFNLGLVLGLEYSRLKAMTDSSPTFLQDMLAGWLQRVDQVLRTGMPTWRKLVEALKDPRVGQNGLAREIEQQLLS